jgi:gas vesicle protein
MRQFAFFLSLLVSSIALAQGANDAVVVGSVTDPNHAGVPRATITLTHVATQAVTKVTADVEGRYRTPPLRIGEYVLTVLSPGFKELRRTGITLSIGDIREINAELLVGQVSQSVSVSDQPPLLQTSDSSVGTVITNKQIVDLPLNGRDYLQLAALSAGTVPAATNGGGISIGGQAGSQAAFLLDGLDNNNQQISTSHSSQKEIIKPSVDAIEEFKVVTNSYSAEFGRSSSGVISVSLKSGTNQIHGSAFEFLRNEVLDAKNYFATQKAPYKRNQFGVAIGGPIWKDHTFLFGDFEIARIRQSITTVSTVPTAAQRAGQLGAASVPDSQIDPIARRILAFYPLPTSTSATNNYVYNSPQPQNPHRWDARLDHILSNSQSVYFRYSSQQVSNGPISSLPPLAGQGYYTGSGAERDDAKSFVLGHTKVWTPKIVTSLHVGWNYLNWINELPSQPLTSVGIPGVPDNIPGFSQTVITGYQTLGITNVPNMDGSQNRQVAGDITWTRGQHTIKTGLQLYWLQTNFLSSQRSTGIFNFNGQYSGNPFADFLRGYASSESVSLPAKLNFRTHYTHVFVQDDWKVRRDLTLNLGLRYEISPSAVDTHDAIANFDMDTNPSSPQIIVAGSQGSGRSSRALQGSAYGNIAPRIGIVYALPGEKTVIRAGYGIFYSNLITLGGMQSLEINPPNTIRVNLSTDPTKPSLFLKNGFPDGTLSFSNASNVTLVSYDRRATSPIAQQWNLNVQRQLPGDILLEVGYFANKFDHNWRQIDGNPAPPGPGNINSRRLFTRTVIPGNTTTTSLADVVRIQKDGWSQFQGLQVKAEKRYAKGLTLIASYGYSKTIAVGDAAGMQNPNDVLAERAASVQDMRQHFVGSSVFALPFGRGQHYGANWGSLTNGALGGWSISPIVTINSGFPVNLTVVGNPANTGQNDRPNIVGDWHVSNPTPQRWFNTAAFAKNAVYTYGNAGRNILRAPGSFNLDVSIHKNFTVYEGVTAQLRMESFNATNTPAFAAPNAQVGNNLFGQISTAGQARNNQLALKVLF